MPTDKIQQLDQLLADVGFAKFERSMPGCEVLHGFVLGRSSSLVLLHVVREFHLDGYSLIRMKDLDAIRCRREEKFFRKMLRAEGVTNDVGMSGKVSLPSMASALKSLGREGRLVSVENEMEDEEVFYAGRVSDVRGKTVELRTFDALGKWDPTPEVIDAAKVTLVSWDTEYLRVFAKHLAQ